MYIQFPVSHLIVAVYIQLITCCIIFSRPVAGYLSCASQILALASECTIQYNNVLLNLKKVEFSRLPLTNKNVVGMSNGCALH